MFGCLFFIIVVQLTILLHYPSLVSAQSSGWSRLNPAYQPAIQPAIQPVIPPAFQPAFHHEPVTQPTWQNLMPPTWDIDQYRNDWGGQGSHFWNWTTSNPWFWNFTIGLVNSGNWTDWMGSSKPHVPPGLSDDTVFFLKNWTDHNPWFFNWTSVVSGGEQKRSRPSRPPSSTEPSPPFTHGDDDGMDDKSFIWTPGSKSPSLEGTRPPHTEFVSRRPVGVYTLRPFTARASRRPDTNFGGYPSHSSTEAPESRHESHSRHYHVGVNQTVHNVANCTKHRLERAFIHVLEMTIEQLLNYNNSGSWSNATCTVQHIFCNSLTASKSAVSSSNTGTSAGMSSAHVIYTVTYDISQSSVSGNAPLLQLHSLVAHGDFSGTLQANAATNNVPALSNAVGTTLSVSAVDTPTTAPVSPPVSSSSAATLSSTSIIAIALGCGLGLALLVLVVLVRRLRTSTTKGSNENDLVTAEARVVFDNTYKASSNAAIIAYVTTDATRLSVDNSNMTTTRASQNKVPVSPTLRSAGMTSLAQAKPVREAEV